jgi:hypothetical protein
MGRWATRLLFSFMVATTMVGIGVSVMAMLDPSTTRDLLDVISAPIFLILLPAALPLAVVLHGEQVALECLPPSRHEARSKQR